MMKKTLTAIALWIPLTIPCGAAIGAQGSGVIVTVNDLPITDFDIDQRIALWNALGQNKNAANPRKQALQSLIDDMIKQAAARKYKAEPTDDQVSAQIDRMAKNSGTDVAGLTAKLKSKGVTMSALKTQVNAQIAFNRLLSALYKVKVEVDPSEVDKKYQEISADPRLKPVTVYNLLEITLPVDKTSDAMMEQLLIARAADAQQYKARFKGCGSARKAASGVYNVQIGKPIKADPARLPPPLRAALDKAGAGSVVGPARTPEGIQLIAFCGRESIAPPKPSREQVETMLVNRKYDTYEERYMRELRRGAFIDYKDPKYAE